MFLFLMLLTLYVLATILTEVEYFGWATLLLVLSVVAAQLFHVVDLLSWAKDHSLQTVLYVLAYVGVGVLWSFIKWFSFLISYRDKFRQLKTDFLKKKMLPYTNGAVPDQWMEEFRNYAQNTTTYSYESGLRYLRKPVASQNKARLVSWMSLWPCSVVGTLLNDPIRRLFSFLFNQFKALYQRMADAVFAKDSELK
jgi:hypothetical protein